MFRKLLALDIDALRQTLGATRTDADPHAPHATASPGLGTLRQPL